MLIGQLSLYTLLQFFPAQPSQSPSSPQAKPKCGILAKEASCHKPSLRAMCEARELDYEIDQSLSAIFNAVGAHDCDEAEQILKKQKKLSLIGKGKIKISELAPFASLTQLESLTLDHQAIQDTQALGELKHLRYLSLQGNQILEVEALKALKKLQLLDLRGNPIAAAHPSLAALAAKVKILTGPLPHIEQEASLLAE